MSAEEVVTNLITAAQKVPQEVVTQLKGSDNQNTANLGNAIADVQASPVSDASQASGLGAAAAGLTTGEDSDGGSQVNL
ncbi:hypothetical protein [Streptomyces huiliensis]|uniref:hypothetical protein n=1 Tax=Streptomyces huiliensis TaxID=2876027 RepID=UPI001CBC3869|nr:hypothetical protein [Streptomyces huiliensis]MBZ4324514.1 hypothetical protein [Streptomyces huiliensis]